MTFPPPPVDTGDGDAKDGSIGDGVEDTGDGVGGGCGVPVLPLEGAGVLHTVSVVVVQARPTPFAPPHVDSAAHGAHGAYPDEEKVLPPVHGVLPLHTVSAVAVHTVLTPSPPQDAPPAHGAHGVYPDEEKVLPSAHGVVHFD